VEFFAVKLQFENLICFCLCLDILNPTLAILPESPPLFCPHEFVEELVDLETSDFYHV
jgi:hypothetical protein